MSDPVEVYVRMYRALETDANGERPAGERGMLGDCFLIRLVAGTAKAHILIDCGMLLGSTNAAARMRTVAEDILAETGGTLDLLVVTHEHWDHISGFSQAPDIFLGTEAGGWKDGRLKIANLWMAWTENPKDTQANGLRARFDKGGAAFAAFAEYLDKAQRAGALPFGLDPDRAMFGLEGFLGARASNGGLLQGRDIMATLKLAIGEAATQFLEPGAVLHTPSAAGRGPSLRAYVLGPPRNEKRLFKDTPSTGAAQETYIDEPTFGAPLMQFVGVESSGPEGGCPPNHSPFSERYCTGKAAEVEALAKTCNAPTEPAKLWWYERYYGAGLATPKETAASERRRIDGDWLGAAGSLALKLDSDTNNTSLALAFDLPDGSAMLFPADAQVGNWLSWHDQSYTDETGTTHTAEQILNRVRFYKVGHHGSHNATLADGGLAMMTRDDLVAAIPTDEPLGAKQGRGGWQMPNPRVYQALRLRTGGSLDKTGKTATGGRILRNDRIYDRANVKPGDVPVGDLTCPANLDETDLFLECQVI